MLTKTQTDKLLATDKNTQTHVLWELTMSTPAVAASWIKLDGALMLCLNGVVPVSSSWRRKRDIYAYLLASKGIRVCTTMVVQQGAYT